MTMHRHLTHAVLLLGLWLGASLCAHAQTKVTYVYTDPQGTPLAEADAQGNITARYDYTPYGNPVPSLGNPPNGPGYTGHVNDPESGLVYMQQRYYDPRLGRFLSPDPVTTYSNPLGAFNRYWYANNNPVVRDDPTGMCADHYRDGACMVIMSKSLVGDKAAQKVQKDMEFILNKYDKSINGLSNNKTYNIEGLRNFGILGRLTGSEVKILWNSTHFKIVPNGTDFRNGGDGGGTGNGLSRLTPKAVLDYERVSPSLEMGVSTIMFHELAHETIAGQAAAVDNFDYTKGKAFEEREQKVQTIGKQMAGSVGAPFYCAASAYGCY
jgi:RHS repeat-associated protein